VVGVGRATSRPAAFVDPTSVADRYRVGMAEDRTWTAAELEQMTPDERHRLVSQGVVTDLADVSPEFLARARTKGRTLLEERGVVARQGDGG
jgi:hypothetical protein